ncbi:MAG: DNA mismatch repair protein MutS [Pseudomonadota bacterium]
MRQFFEIKARYPDCILFYRMGDFYELFFEDALTASSILDIALTKRGKHNGDDIPMCGVPVHAAEAYLPKLIASGHKIAICEQMETPEDAKKRGYKEIVRRDVVRIVTPGTITEETLLAPTSAHYLAAVSLAPSAIALAWLELTTGEFQTSSATLAQLPAMLARINPRELLLTQAAYDQLQAQPWFLEWRDSCSMRPDVQFEAKSAQRRLNEHYKVADSSVFGEFTPAEISACGALIDYVQLTQMAASARLDAPKQERYDDSMQMDGATRRNLELTQTLGGARRGSLLHRIDETVSAAGSRLLCQWVSAPSRQLATIGARHDAVAWAVEQAPLREQLRKRLAAIADMERAIGRLSLGRGGPRDVLLMAGGLTQTTALYELLRDRALPELLAGARSALAGHHLLAEQLSAALKPEVPHLVRDGNFIADGFRADLDEWRRLRDESRRVIALMESKLKADTGIPSLKIKHNNVLGYFIEITPIHEKKVPIEFIHRQGLAGALRYSTPELNDTARKIEEAADKALKLELMLFDELVASILQASPAIVAAARALALIDAACALAELAQAGSWVRPAMTSDTRFIIKAGRHTVVEAALRRAHQEFIPNDCVMGEGAGASPTTTLLITGPNMGGKSTFLRQQAILTILAQMGSFVPAEAAQIGVVDKLFCRVGAADDLARGQSTFMVEMVETASILHQASQHSLVVLDEIGRGTATYDGVSIAWAVAEHLHNITQCRALFATHYHELTALAQTLPRLKNYHASAKEYQGQLVFLHTIREGHADKSYGIHVAALAGMPKPVLARARSLLTTLESGHSLTENKRAPELPLFAVAEKSFISMAHEQLIKRIASVDVNNLTPMDALQLLSELAKSARES